MRVDGWRIDRFGTLVDWQVAGLADAGLIVLQGANESGKSTLRSFLTTAYFGFAPARRDQHPYAPADGPFGGALQLIDADGERLSIERELRSTPRGRLHRPTVHTDLANRPLPDLESISRAIYDGLHSISLDDLTAISPAAWRALEDRLLSGSALAFLRSAADVRRALEGQAQTLWRGDRRGKPESARLRDRLKELRESEREAREGGRRIGEIDRLLAAAATEVDGVRREATALHDRRRRHAKLAPALAAWREVTRLRTQADALLEHDDLPVDPVEVLDRRRADADTAETARLAAVGELESFRRRLTVDADARRLADAIPALRELSAAESAAVGPSAVLVGARRDAAAHRRDADRLAVGLLGRPLAGDDLAALATVRIGELRAAVAAAARPVRRRIAAAASVAAVALAVLAATGPVGRVGPLVATLVLLSLAVIARRSPGPAHVRRALGDLPVAAARLARPDGALPADVDALREAVRAVRTIDAEIATLVDEERGLAARQAAVLTPLGYATSAEALTAADDARSRVEDGAAAAAALPAATAEIELRTADAAAAAARRDALIARLAVVAVGEGIEAGIAAVRRARALRTAADERERSALAQHPDLDEIVKEAADLDRRGTPLVLDAAALAELEASEARCAAALETLQRQVGDLEGERRALGAGPAAADVAGEAAAVAEQLAAVAIRRDRYVLAAAILRQAEETFRDRHGPAFLAVASRHLAAITSGRYERIVLAEHDDATAPRLEVVREGEAIAVAPPLSRGTLEQIHLALRLALVDEIDPGQLLPLYLDEALVNWDEERVEGLLPLLQALAGRQAFLATCHRELARRLAAAGACVVTVGGSATGRSGSRAGSSSERTGSTARS